MPRDVSLSDSKCEGVVFFVALHAGSLMGDVSERYSGVFVLQAVRSPVSQGGRQVGWPVRGLFTHLQFAHGFLF